jgi:hypothetical protein
VGGAPQFSGTSFALEGIGRTKIVSVNDWRDYGNSANMLLFAKELHDALADTVIEGDLVYHGLLSSVLDFGHALSIAADSYTTGWEAAGVPIVSVDLAYNEGPGGTSYETTLHVSNRRAPYSGSVFTRPSQTGQPYGMPGPNQMLGISAPFQYAPDTPWGTGATSFGTPNVDTSPGVRGAQTPEFDTRPTWDTSMGGGGGES